MTRTRCLGKEKNAGVLQGESDLEGIYRADGEREETTMESVTARRCLCNYADSFGNCTFEHSAIFSSPNLLCAALKANEQK